MDWVDCTKSTSLADFDMDFGTLVQLSRWHVHKLDLMVTWNPSGVQMDSQSWFFAVNPAAARYIPVKSLVELWTGPSMVSWIGAGTSKTLAG